MIKWKKARFGKFRAMVEIITPSCLRVDSAIIFLRSHSTIAAMPAINMVQDAIINRKGENKGRGERIG